MFSQVKTYYLTLLGPRRGERVVASVTTNDQIFAEKLFGCGLRNDKDFCFRGLYTEEEVLHMFKPGTDIVRTFNPVTGGCEKHKDYHKVPAFEVEDKKVYRLKDNKRLLIDLTADNSTFDYVKDVLSGKVQASLVAIMSTDSNKNQSVLLPTTDVMYKNINNAVSDLGKSVVSDDPLDALDEDFGEPIFDDEDVDIVHSLRLSSNIKDISSSYTKINTIRNPKSEHKDDDFISSFDAVFYGGQQKVIQSDMFKHDEKLQNRFKMNQSNTDLGEHIRSFLNIKNS